MNADEMQIYEFLKNQGDTFVAAGEVSKKLGVGRRGKDRMWAKPLLRRMEMDGILESNAFGEYRVRVAPEGGIDFKDALKTPGTPLGDTTIIRVEDVQKPNTASRTGTLKRAA
jgi:hypothetical protein